MRASGVYGLIFSNRVIRVRFMEKVTSEGKEGESRRKFRGQDT